ncbi:hypothetical protein WA026_002233 [Henosepilachna vigintioctopunctata]|uniref:Uncharacterized protein n=1 Tax=Henosepilachna vigintioctopunctata TaxID=420089 RepID=A0AAW1TUB8_9CUCU
MRKSNNSHPVVITTSISNINSSIPAAMTNAITSITSTSNKTKVKPTVTLAKSIIMSNAPLSTRRSVRSAMPAQNTRSKGDMKIHVDGTTAAADAVRRKTRSAVVDLDIKRKKEVK